MDIDKKKRGRYFATGEGEPAVEKSEIPKGSKRQQIELESAQRKKREKLEREKQRIKREIRREHLNGHQDVDYDIIEKWDRESKVAVYSLLGLKVLLLTFALFEIYHAIVYKSFFLF